MRHIPVMKQEVLEALTFAENTVYVDATLGLAGHFKAMVTHNPTLQQAIGFDMDLSNLGFAKNECIELCEQISCTFIHSQFRNMRSKLTELGLAGEITSILFDLGISSVHVDEAERGFSFLKDAPLDMRLDQTSPLTAAMVLNSYSEERLADIFFHYGEERFSRKIARAIVHDRTTQSFSTTLQLAGLIERITPKKFNSHKHPATQVFQALRIEVNDELEQIREALNDAIDLLAPGGRIAVLSYHSLEDTIVKHIFKKAATDCICNPKLPICTCEHTKSIQILTKKPLVPSSEEVSVNNRARSAKLRIIQKL